MASDDSNSVITHEDEDDDQNHQRNYSMSRLSMCNDDMMLNMSRLSVEEGSEVDADGELSDGEEEHVPTDDSDRETGWFSLPQQRRVRRGCEGRKEYGSENERSTSNTAGGTRTRRRRRRRRGSSSSMNMMMRQRERIWLERAWKMRKGKAAMEDIQNPSGESECVVIAKGEGGKRLSMDMEEIKACRDLGFDLKGEWTLEIPTTTTTTSRNISGSTIDTDSGGNSPIATWRISSPGDDPRDVKARLKVWAQVVALTSASRLNG